MLLQEEQRSWVVNEVEVGISSGVLPFVYVVPSMQLQSCSCLPCYKHSVLGMPPFVGYRGLLVTRKGMNMDGVIILELSRVSVTAFGFAPVLRVTTFLPELMWLTFSASTTSLKLTEVFSFYLNFSGILSQGSVNRCKRNSLL